MKRSATPLTLLALFQLIIQKITKNRIASLRSGFLLLGLLSIASSQLRAEQITIATATNFLTTLKELQQVFTEQSDHSLTIVSGSSGVLAAQIINGAPFDVFLSADHTRPDQLIARGLGDKSSRFTYAYGKLALWSLDKKLLTQTNSQHFLKTGNFPHIAIANPALAPYGLASIETLRSLGLYFDLSKKFIKGENISQTFTLIASGSVPLGFVAHSQLIRSPWNNKGSYWLVPSNLHQPIKQDAIIVSKSKNQPAAKKFMQFLKSAPAIKTIQSSGYSTKRDNQMIN